MVYVRYIPSPLRLRILADFFNLSRSLHLIQTHTHYVPCADYTENKTQDFHCNFPSSTQPSFPSQLGMSSLSGSGHIQLCREIG